MAASQRAALRHVESDLRSVILVCRKCSKRINGGFGDSGEQRLAKALRRHMSRTEPAVKQKRRRVRTLVLEVGCLDLCPKDAVVVLRADRPQDWVLARRGASLPDLVEHLGLDIAADRRV